jgi:hypothetical protein
MVYWALFVKPNVYTDELGEVSFEISSEIKFDENDKGKMNKNEISSKIEPVRIFFMINTSGNK